MIILAVFAWWYTAGWAQVARRVTERVRGVLESFSAALLARTLFAPFRQISADRVQGPLNTQVRAFGDRLFSRVFGAFVRSVVIVAGLLAGLIVGVLGSLQVVLWPVVPLLPMVGLLAMLLGWGPL